MGSRVKTRNPGISTHRHGPSSRITSIDRMASRPQFACRCESVPDNNPRVTETKARREGSARTVRISPKRTSTNLEPAFKEWGLMMPLCDCGMNSATFASPVPFDSRATLQQCALTTPHAAATTTVGHGCITHPAPHQCWIRVRLVVSPLQHGRSNLRFPRLMGSARGKFEMGPCCPLATRSLSIFNLPPSLPAATSGGADQPVEHGDDPIRSSKCS